MKQFFFAIAVLMATWTTAVTPASATAVDGTSKALITSLGKAVVDILENPALSPKARAEQYSAHFEKAFDWDRISAFAIGKYQRGVPRKKFVEYRDLFAQHMTRLYAAKFADYSGEAFLVKGERQFGRGGSEVTAEIRDANDRETVRLAFKVVQEDGKQRIYDVLINGVSLLVAKRSELKGIISRGGIDGLIAQLKKANTH